MSPSELVANFLHGIPLCTPDGRQLSFQVVKQKIKAAQRQVENLFSIKLNRQIIRENRDFIRNQFNQFGYVRSMYPVNTPFEMKGVLNTVEQVNYPKGWLSVKRDEDVATFRNIYLIPNTGGGATMTQNAYVYSGISPNLGFFGSDFIANYWRIVYSTGWNDIPADLFSFVGRLASIPLLGILGDILLGVGLTGSTVSLDGVSQSISTTRSSQGGLFAGRIKQYADELKEEANTMKYVYRGILFEVL